MKNNRTESLKRKLFLTRLFSFICTVLPLVIYIIIGLTAGDIYVGQKVFLGFTVIIAIILTLVNVLMKYKLRSPLFILLLGVHYTLDRVLTLLIILSVGIIIDEFILSPTKNSLKQKVAVRKELEHGDNE